METLGHRPALDGLRALAIAAVVGYHAFFVPADGWLGVDLFFVLSGFLITTLLLEEHDATGHVRIGAFYLRRAYRLLPAALLMLAVVALAWAVTGRLTGSRAVVLAEALGYVMNLVLAGWFGHSTTAVSHLWSLALEEQFYLVWPALLFVVLRARRRVALVALIVTAVLVAVNGAVRVQGDGHRALFAPDTRSVGILVGCAAAIALSLRPVTVHRVARFAWPPALAVAVALTFEPYGLAMFGSRLLVFAVAIAILVVSGLHAGPATWVLSRAPLTYLGRISYSLYLWHVPIFVEFGIIGKPVFPAGSLPVRLVAIACSCLAAAASYHFVENPIRRRSRRARAQPRAALVAAP